MAATTRTASVFLPRSAFDAFLFAPIGEDRNGMELSVVSGLARLDRDPWQEAADLAGLPRDTAIQRLTAMIAALGDGLSAPPDAGAIAGRLVLLLPRWTQTKIQAPKLAQRLRAWANPQIILVILLLIVLAAQWVAARHQTQGFAGRSAGASVESLGQ